MNAGRAVTAASLGLAVTVLAGIGVSAIARANEPIVIPITIRYSHFEPARITLPAGRPVTFVITAAGSQQFICHLPGHERNGMVGTVVATPGG